MTNKQLLEELVFAFLHFRTFEFKNEQQKQEAYDNYKYYKDLAMQRMDGRN